MPINAQELSRNLSRVIDKMLVPARTLGDDTTAMALEHQAATLRKGLVRVALIGSTSSGKSTIINALLRQMVVPENPAVCSPVPVWIYHHTGSHVEVEVIRRAKGKTVAENTDLDDFMTKCCYNVSDITNAERVRFENILDASIALESDILSSGAILIDTLGIAASAVDTGKTLAILNEGVDLVIFASKNPQLLQDEVQFLREYVLGYEPKKHKVNYPVDPKNLILVLNDFGMMTRPRLPFVQSTLNIFQGTSKLSGKAHEAWVESNVFDIQALYARLLRCNAPYPYDRLAPAGSTREEKAELVERMQGEEGVLAYCKATPGMEERSGINAFQAGLLSHVRRRSVGKDSVALTRIQSLQSIMNQIRSAANSRVQNVTSAGSHLAALRQSIQNLESNIKTDNVTLQRALNQLKAKYIKGFNAVFQKSFGPNGTLRNSCKGVVLREYAMPPEFNSFDRGAFLRMTDQQKVEMLDPYVDKAVEMLTAYCREKVLETLKDTHSDNGIPMPMEVLEESRTYVTAQAKSLNDLIASLNALGVAEQLGVMLPKEQAVETFFVNLQTELEQNLLLAISKALSNGLDKFNAQRATFVSSVAGGFFIMLKTIFGGNAVIWDRLRSHYLLPLTDFTLDALGDFGNANLSGGLNDAVNDAYTQVLVEIANRRQGIVIALDNSYACVTDEISVHGRLSEKTVNEMNTIKATCDKLEKELNAYQTSLLQA